MITSVVDDDLEVHHFVTRQKSVFRGFLNTFVDGGDIFLGNGTAHRFVHEFVARAGFLGFETQFTMTVLAFTARLTDVFAFRLDRLC